MARIKNIHISEEVLRGELTKALDEIGLIEPWYDEEYQSWLYSHPIYPVECEGTSKEEVKKKYPEYLATFIEHRLQGRIDAINENQTKGHGGYRPGAGRPKGSYKSPTKQVRLPIDIANWLKEPGVIDHLRSLIHAYEHHSFEDSRIEL